MKVVLIGDSSAALALVDALCSCFALFWKTAVSQMSFTELHVKRHVSPACLKPDSISRPWRVNIVLGQSSGTVSPVNWSNKTELILWPGREISLGLPFHQQQEPRLSQLLP